MTERYEHLMMNHNNCIGIGSVELKKGESYTKLSRDYIDKALELIEKMGTSHDIIILESGAVMFGQLSKDKKKASGVLIAPMVYDDE